MTVHIRKRKLQIIWEEVFGNSTKERLIAAFEMLLLAGRNREPLRRNIDKEALERKHIE
jgi:hypothetical protein